MVGEPGQGGAQVALGLVQVAQAIVDPAQAVEGRGVFRVELVRLLDQARWRNWLQRRVRWLDRGCGGLLLALGGWLLLGAL